MFLKNVGVFRIAKEFRDRVLSFISTTTHKIHDIHQDQDRRLTLDINLNTEVWAISNSCSTSCNDLSMDSSSPTALVIRPARLLRSAWSMFSSHGEPGAKKALYRPGIV